jgi:hypothetical protein
VEPQAAGPEWAKVIRCQTETRLVEIHCGTPPPAPTSLTAVAQRTGWAIVSPTCLLGSITWGNRMRQRKSRNENRRIGREKEVKGWFRIGREKEVKGWKPTYRERERSQEMETDVQGEGRARASKVSAGSSVDIGVGM